MHKLMLALSAFVNVKYDDTNSLKGFVLDNQDKQDSKVYFVDIECCQHYCSSEFYVEDGELILSETYDEDEQMNAQELLDILNSLDANLKLAFRFVGGFITSINERFFMGDYCHEEN